MNSLHCSVLHAGPASPFKTTLQHTAPLKYAATHSYILQHAATQCNLREDLGCVCVRVYAYTYKRRQTEITKAEAGNHADAIIAADVDARRHRYSACWVMELEAHGVHT